MNLSLNRIVDWIVKNRSGTAFKDYSKQKIEEEIYESIFFCIFRIALDEQGNIVGVVCGNKDINKKTIHIMDILTTKKGIVDLFLQDCNKHYPDYMIIGIAKNERPRVFSNAKQLIGRVS